MKRSGQQEHEEELIQRIAGFRHDPYGYVKFAYPWGEPGGPLERFTGPQPWQCERLEKFGDLVRGVSLSDLDMLDAIGDPLPQLGYGKGRDATASGKGIGKAQPLSTFVLTPAGVRRWGSLQPGDFVFAEDGSPTRILQCHYKGHRPIVRVVLDDGSETLCDREHLWKVMGRSERRNDKGAVRANNWVVETADELLARGLRFGGKLNARQFEIPTQGAVSMRWRVLAIDPYLLGVWLGDGSRNIPRWSKPDVEVAAEVTRRGYIVRADKLGMSHYVCGVKDAFRSYKVFGCHSFERYVPLDYMHADMTQRRDMLCGLLDTDGECNAAGSIIFSSTSKQLVDDVMWLARSLGGKAQPHPTTKSAAYKTDDGTRIECKDCYRCTLALTFNPFRIARKAARWHMPEARYFKRWIDRIEPAGEEECMCISVAHPSHCYLTNDFIVTHNSALVSWTIDWGLTTFPDTKGVLTAGTEPQLRTKTWPEVAKWRGMSICSHWFRQIGTSIYSADPDHKDTWRFDALPWNENRMEAFAGLHNQGKRIVVVFDEASQIADVIWDTTDGIFTDADTEVLWVVFGNPTRGNGRFFDCFNAMRARWHHTSIDSRTVPITDKNELKQLVDYYGEDSDYVRVNVLGMFPSVSDMQFISQKVVAEARKREVITNLRDPLVMGVDVGRFGPDPTEICFRKGRDARTIPWITLRGADTMVVAGRVAEEFDRYKADALFVDGTGLGAGVVDRLAQLGYPVRDINFGAKADRVLIEVDATRYANKRSEMWGYAREWLKGGALPDDADLEAELTGIQYGYKDSRTGSDLMLEKKDDMKKRGLASPNKGDALALTFAYPVNPRPLREAGGPHQVGRTTGQGRARIDYEPNEG